MDQVISMLMFSVGCAALDRLRGMDTFIPAAATKLLFGFLVAAFIVNPDSFEVVAAAALFALGSAPGWGTPINAALSEIPMKAPFERWQTLSLLQTNTPAALAARGLFWGAPMTLMVAAPSHNWLYLVVAPAMAVAFTAAPYITNQLVKEVRSRWAIMEWIRGGLFGLILGAASLV